MGRLQVQTTSTGGVEHAVRHQRIMMTMMTTTTTRPMVYSTGYLLRVGVED
jgi:hypothetical protein